MFLDEAIVDFISGNGGAGASSFHREKHVPRGGPNGADGGKGGDIVLIADTHKRTLYDFQFLKTFQAQNGSDAHTNKNGKDGADVEIKVPVGSIIWDAETGEMIVDMATDGMRFVLCKGGRGGFGNLHYTNSVRQAPTISQKGAPGDVLHARMELKLLADVGLVGLPNAGKSTLISQISAAKPKIADYPFTTIVPNLGVVFHEDVSFTVADMPGLIEGASEGRGLGHQFLKHVERTRVLIHVVDCIPVNESDPIENYKLIEGELQQYSEEIWSRPRIVALNKIDAMPEEMVDELLARFKTFFAESGADSQTIPQIFAISAVAGKNIKELLHATLAILRTEWEKAESVVVVPQMARGADDDSWDVVEVEDGFKVIGKRIERMVLMTPLNNNEALRHLHRRLQRIGVIRKLEEMGARSGDTVSIGSFAFDYDEEF